MKTTEKGFLHAKGEIKTGQSKGGYEWATQDFVLRIDGGEYKDRFISLRAKNQETLRSLRSKHEGDAIEVTFLVSAFEWNGRFCNECIATYIKDERYETAPEAEPTPAPAPTTEESLEPNEEDLPF